MTLDKLWAALGAAAVMLVAAVGVYYGVPPEYSEEFLAGVVSVISGSLP